MMEERKKNKLIYKIYSILMLAMIVILILVTIIFRQAGDAVKTYVLAGIETDAERVMKEIDTTITNIYNVSDTFAGEPRLIEHLEESYEEDDHTRKQLAVNYIVKRLFDGYDLLLQNQQIGGILTYKGELFNFLDTNYDDEVTIQRLQELGIEDEEKLGKFSWYPVQNNFLVERSYENIREDYVVIGSRRIYSPFKNSYPYVHVFALKEQYFYGMYEGVADKYGGTVLIMDEEGTLFSSSDPELIEAGAVSGELTVLLKETGEQGREITYEGNSYVVSMSASGVNDWQTVVMVPIEEIIGYVQGSYLKMMGVLILCVIIFAVVLLYLYRSFMNPIAKIMEHMRMVYEGDLDAYADIRGDQETGNMGRYFNEMLRSINLNVKERLESEKKEKELEMDVLMGQINPHFLYNTLETIVWKAQAAGSPEIGRIAASLGRFYRLSINNGDIMIPFPKEIEQVMAYIRIQKSRYGDDFMFELRSDVEKVRELHVLKLILQPVIENCFVYGMEELERTLKIRLTIHVGADTVKIRVADNGNGISAERLQEVRRQIREGNHEQTMEYTGSYRKQGTGIGLRSVYERLETYFGVSNGVSIFSREHSGTVVVIELPVRKQLSGEREDKYRQ